MLGFGKKKPAPVVEEPQKEEVFGLDVGAVFDQAAAAFNTAKSMATTMSEGNFETPYTLLEEYSNDPSAAWEAARSVASTASESAAAGLALGARAVGSAQLAASKASDTISTYGETAKDIYERRGEYKQEFVATAALVGAVRPRGGLGPAALGAMGLGGLAYGIVYDEVQFEGFQAMKGGKKH